MQKVEGMSELYQTVMDAAVDAIIVIDNRGNIVHFSPSAERLFGYSIDECLGRNVSMLMPEPFRANHDSYIQHYQQTGEARIIGIGRDVKGISKNGRIFPMHLSVGKTHIGEHCYYIGICHDLTDYQAVLAELVQAEKRYKSIVDSQGQIICRLDKQHNITFANTAFRNLLGEAGQDITGIPFMQLIQSDHSEVEHILQRLLAVSVDTEIHTKAIMRHLNGYSSVEWWFKRITDSDGSGDEIQGFGIDISEKERVLEEAAFLKKYDSLTGLLNSVALCQAFPDWCEPDTSYAVLYFDCNHFALINHKYGYTVGDSILREGSLRLRKSLKVPALLARPGADEFIVVVRVKSNDEAASIASRLLNSLEQPYLVEEDKLLPTGKVGISMYPHDADQIEGVIQLAEAALSRIQLQQSAIAFFDSSFHEELKRQLDIEQGLRQALLQKELQVYLQPKVALCSRDIVGYEALLRWHHDKLGQVSPAEFMLRAEQIKMGIDIDRYVLTEVFYRLQQCLKAGKKCHSIAVNITSQHFSDPTLIEYIKAQSEQYQVPLSLLELEITEGVLMESSPVVTSNLATLRELGVKLAIDDFGTGYSSLNYLRTLPANILKVDQSFVRKVASETEQTLIAAIVTIATAVNMQIVAEGIETAQQVDILHKLGCQMGQGYYFARPAPIAQVLGLA